ncbi:MAG: hypothetical protein KGR26_06940 [Cyanobacteria bacterium REEB65]|nr:hypothetical protein [Cyanobacteria bacterium REEB65]
MGSAVSAAGGGSTVPMTSAATAASSGAAGSSGTDASSSADSSGSSPISRFSSQDEMIMQHTWSEFNEDQDRLKQYESWLGLG